MSEQLQIWQQYPEEEIVVKANELVMGQLNWRVREYRVFIAHVSQISRDEDSLEQIGIRIQDLCEMSDIQTENLYSEMPEIADRLTDKKIHIERKERGNEVGGYCNVYSSCTYDKTTGEIRGRFTDEIRPFLFDLKERFTMYFRRHALSMRSTYSMRFYEIIKRYEYQGQFKLEVSELRKMFGLQDKYDRFGDLRRYVIDKAQEELKEKVGLTFEYSVVRDGQKPIAIDFNIVPVGRDNEDTSMLRKIGKRREDEEKSAYVRTYENMPRKQKKRIKKEARERAKRNNPDAGERALLGQMWYQIHQIINERGILEE